ncbi:MAG TPA: DegT/DnrJ/EryC1/StrS family aminotransferase [Candidatus Acidoferrales bacterium]|nr:DegT/DnrJ/EryC1/StrS family aminotransferase [Candidatus Acidoferrales bacterium]
MSEELALLGGNPVRSRTFPTHPVIGDAEKKAVLDVLNSGKLSSFIAVPGEYFNGGQRIKKFERQFAEFHGVRYAVAFNSATAALHAAVVAAGVTAEAEVIVPPYTFTSTATCALMHNAIPVFADIDEDAFGLDPTAVERAVTPLTRAIIVVHLFGHPANLNGLLEVARRHNLRVIEDCAQAPGARYNDRFVGTFGDCGVFSFTESKTITTGEGGMLITDSEEIAAIARMVRNHGEMIAEGQKERTYASSMLGWNYRMTEMEAALGIVQFGKLEQLNEHRADLANYLSAQLSSMDGLKTPAAAPRATHVYYVYALKYDEDTIGLPRDVFVRALNAEGIPFGAGYVRPLYLSALYQEKRHFAFEHYTGTASYERGLCPTAERLHEKELMLTAVARFPATHGDMDDVADAIHKVMEQKEALCRMACA